ncbi:MAG TPA: NAD+ synthase [Candidatus Polarisedimenticolia bacterium]|nr:NAD+ synthase [Candidatus Polarisedimenticolia bacterium]
MPRVRSPDTSLPEELRIDAEGTIDILVEVIRDEVRRAGFRLAVLGLSGGIDSAVSAALAARALGAKNVLSVLLPYRSSDPQSARDAAVVARRLGTPTETIPITPMIDAYFRRDRQATRLRRGNKMARERMAVLYDVSLRDRRLVIGTSNKTEILIGYGTLFGDLASGVNPLGDLYKTQVRQVALALGLPEELVWKTASADLWQGQSDESDIGYRYRDIDAVLLRLVERRDRPEDVVKAGFPKRMVADLHRRMSRSQFKRRPPIIAKLTRRAVNIDFRYPRDWGS